MRLDYFPSNNNNNFASVSVNVVVNVALLVVACVLSSSSSSARLIEDERIQEFYRRNYTWPPQPDAYKPSTEGWIALNEHRLRQVAEIEDNGFRYEGYLQTIHTALLAPNFTEHGFGLTKAPEDLMIALRAGIRDGFKDGKVPKLEGDIECINGQNPPWFIDRPDLTDRVLKELQSYPETWSNMELTAHRAYGFRLYRNDAQLRMHVDKSQTHIISFILHIDSSDDAEPWPILIEDFHGNTHEVILRSGDILFYESSKVFHGRPIRFKGSWYSSVFVHYYPKYGWQDEDHMLERHYAVPPEWRNKPSNTRPKFEIPLTMVGTGLAEPTCPNEWCSSQKTIKWSGTGDQIVRHGEWVSPTGERYPFHPEQRQKGVVADDNIDAPAENVPVPVPPCEDLDDRCEWWASWDSNECETNQVYMRKHCKKTCNACGTSSSLPSTRISTGDEL